MYSPDPSDCDTSLIVANTAATVVWGVRDYGESKWFDAKIMDD